MATTQFLYRVLFAIGASRRATFNAYWDANIDTAGAGAQTFSVGLSPTGAAPATHWGACSAFNSADFKKVMQRLCSLSSITPPANWDALTRIERRDWLRSKIPAIRAAIGVALLVDDQDGRWDDYDAALAGLGLRPVRP